LLKEEKELIVAVTNINRCKVDFVITNNFL